MKFDLNEFILGKKHKAEKRRTEFADVNPKSLGGKKKPVKFNAKDGKWNSEECIAFARTVLYSGPRALADVNAFRSESLAGQRQLINIMLINCRDLLASIFDNNEDLTKFVKALVVLNDLQVQVAVQGIQDPNSSEFSMIHKMLCH